MLRFVEDFGSDSLANIRAAGRWDQITGSYASLSTNAGPFGEAAFVISNPNPGIATGNIIKTTIGDGTQMTTVYMCGWWKYSSQPLLGSCAIWSILDGATIQISLSVNTAGALEIRRGNSGSALLATSSVIAAGQWGWLVMKVVLGTGTAGSVELRWNNADIISPTSSLNTAPSGTAQVNSVSVGHLGGSAGGNSGFSHYLSDFIVLDQQGSVNNTLPSASRVYFFLPTSNGTYSQFTPLSGANWQRVSNNPDTGDSSYNYSSTASQKDTFNHSTMAGNIVTISGVQTQFSTRIDDAGAHTTQCVLYDGTTEVDTPSPAPSVSATYSWIETIQETNLTSGLAFTPSDINNLQFGYKLVT